jgi:hypothetical protein
VDARRFIAQMCSRFRVSLDFGRRLQPLAEKAAKAEPGKQRLLLELIERSFAEEGRRAELERSGCSPEDWRALVSVASRIKLGLARGSMGASHRYTRAMYPSTVQTRPPNKGKAQSSERASNAAITSFHK